jgi:hypothetical protein
MSPVTLQPTFPQASAPRPSPQTATPYPTDIYFSLQPSKAANSWIAQQAPSADGKVWTDWITAWSGVLLGRLTGSGMVKKYHALYGTRRFITAVTTVRHLSLSWTSSIQSIPPHSTSRKSVLILTSHLRLWRYFDGQRHNLSDFCVINPVGVCEMWAGVYKGWCCLGQHQSTGHTRQQL